jgi:hypothetical protein
MGATPTPELAQPINYQTGSKLRPIFHVVVLCVRGFWECCVYVCATVWVWVLFGCERVLALASR